MGRQLGGVELPDDIIDVILSFCETGYTWKLAKEIQAALMKERKFMNDGLAERLEREFTLCEH